MSTTTTSISTPADTEKHASAAAANPSSTKPRNPLFDFVLGYPRIAGRFALKPETAAFRRFSALNARIMLYLQADLCRLEKKLHEREKIDSECRVRVAGANKHKYAVNYDTLRLSSYEEEPLQWRLIVEIKEKLKEYNALLIQQSHLHKLKPPEDFDLRDFQHFLSNYELMNVLPLRGADSSVWGSTPSSSSPTSTPSIDLITPHPSSETDPFTRFLAFNLIHLLSLGLARFMRPNKRTGTIGYHDSTVLKLTTGLTSILASLIPVASIVVLSALGGREMGNGWKRQVAAMAGFNVLLAGCLNGFTGAGRGEVFAVVAGFTAVQAVFLGTNGDWMSSC